MGTIAHKFRALLEYVLGLCDLMPSFWALTLVSCITGVILLWLVGKLTPQRRLDVARSRVASAIYELRLFLDSPRRMFAAQGRLLGWLGVYLAYLMPAFIVLSLPLGLLYVHLDVRYGQAPLPVGEAIVVKVDLDDGVDGYEVTAQPAPGIEVTAPPLYIENEQRVYLRVVVNQPGTHTLRVQAGDHVAGKLLVADPAAVKVSPERRAGLAQWWTLGHEPPLDSGIAAITFQHPPRPQQWLGLPMPWWIYWLIVSTFAALALRRPMGVVL